MSQLKQFSYLAQFAIQRVAFVAILLSAVLALGATVMAFLGVMPWLELPVGFGGVGYPEAGMWVQIALTALLVMLCGYLPSNARVMALENSHRAFSVNMNDVARSYAMAHAADRNGAFKLSSEFDAVRERLGYLRHHPDLESLEPEILEMAAQMSHISREMAEVYSDDKVSRARSFLKERQTEIERFNSRLEEAKAVSRELSHWLHEVELEESVAASQLMRLKDELREVLPELGLEETIPAAMDAEPIDNVVDISNVPDLDRSPKVAE